jgi:hypothetical protein
MYKNDFQTYLILGAPLRLFLQAYSSTEGPSPFTKTDLPQLILLPLVSMPFSFWNKNTLTRPQ